MLLRLKLTLISHMQIATSGKGFCRAAGKASALIVSNILRVAAVNIIGDLILFLGKVCVSLACALFAFLMLETHKYKSGNSKVSSPLFPVLVSNCPTLYSPTQYACNSEFTGVYSCFWRCWLFHEALTVKKLMGLEFGLGYAQCAVLLGSRLHHCWYFLCGGGDGNWHNSAILLHWCRGAQWHCHVCTPFAHGHSELPCPPPRGSWGWACVTETAKSCS